MRLPADVNTMRDESSCPVCGSEYDGMLCDSCGFESPPPGMENPNTEKKGRSPQYQTQPEGSGGPPVVDQDEEIENEEASQLTDAGEAANDPTTRINELEQEILQLKDLQNKTNEKQGATMSRFDNELRPRKRQAMVPGVQYDQVSTMNLPTLGLDSMAPTPVPSQWKDVMPERNIDVQNLDAVDIQGGPGDSRVIAEPDQYAMNQPVGERAAAKHIRSAARGLAEKSDTESVDKSFWAAHEALKTASINNPRLKIVDRRLGLIFKSLKEGSSIRVSEVVDRLKEVHDNLQEASVEDTKPGYKTDRNAVQATNGNQETSKFTNVQDLDDITESRDEVMTPDAVESVVVPNLQPNQLQLADVPPYYNDGASTGYTPQVSENKAPWPGDATNPALVPYQASKSEEEEEEKFKKHEKGKKGKEEKEEEEKDEKDEKGKKEASVKTSRENLLQAVNLVDRLERLGMTRTADRAKHIAEYEQMTPEKIAGVMLMIENMESSGAVKTRTAQRVVKGPQGRMPEMGQATRTASVSKQDVQKDDFLMTL